MGKLLINGVDITNRFGVVVSGTGTYDSPVRSYTTYQINGRSGDIFVDNGRFENVNITYPCYISSDFPRKFKAFKSFLLSISGYARLEDSYDPGNYREGIFVSEIVPETTALNRAGSFDITFNCKPQCFLKSGSVKQTFSYVHDERKYYTTYNLMNPTNYDAKPLIRFKGYHATNSQPQLDINGQTVVAYPNSGSIDNWFEIDTEYNNVIEDGQLANYKFSGYVGLKLKPGMNELIVRPNVTVEIIPRWWTV